MMSGFVEMSLGELERAYVIRQVCEGRLTQVAAGERLGLVVRQVKRLCKRWRECGDFGLVSRKRGKPSNHQMDAVNKAKIEELLHTSYANCGPTFVADKLFELEGIKVSKETVRRMQIVLGLHKSRLRKKKRVFQTRPRRSRYGEMVQIDGSPHDWFEGRSEYCTLIVFIDDATSRLMALRFVTAETTKAYLETLREYVLQHGMPLVLYSDRHGIFRVNAKEAESGDGLTEFGRVIQRLGIKNICAHTPQAKGRVERANQTLQDRLVKEMRLREISSIDEANRFVPEFIKMWESKFSVLPADPENAHRPFAGTLEMLDEKLAKHEERVLSKNLTFRYEGALYGIKTPGLGLGLRGTHVTLQHFLDGNMIVRYKGQVLKYVLLEKAKTSCLIENEKTLNKTVDDLLKAA